jgi:hypothetical protein
VSVSGSGFTGQAVSIYGSGVDSNTLSVMSDTLIQGSVQVNSGIVSQTFVSLVVGDGACAVALEPTDPTPSITGVTPPPPWPAGQQVTFTVNGTGFGTDPNLTITDANGTQVYSGSCWGSQCDTSIGGTVTIYTSGNATATVASNGYSGMGFLGNPGEPASNSWPLEVSGLLTTPSVQSLSYQSDNGYVNATSGTIYVAVGTSVTFLAAPSSGGFSGGLPAWSGSANVSGTGSAVTVTFSEVSASLNDLKTVSATLGNTLTASVLVFDFDGVLTPDDNFEGRSLSDFGVGETISLSFTTTPQISESQAGGLEWLATSGGDITDNGDGTGNYAAPDSSGTLGLALQIKQGPSKGQNKQKSANIVPPSAAYQQRKAGTGIYHVQGACSVGHQANTYVTPANVSFKNIEVREGDGVVAASGYLGGADGLHHGVGGFSGVTGCSLNGCLLDAYDTVEIEVAPPVTPFYPGTFDLPIPREYRVIGSDRVSSFATLTHHATCDGEGTATQSKGGVGPISKRASDPSSSY